MNENYLIHYGVLGMKWGIRRYQNKDGTRTALGKKRYGMSGAKSGSESKWFKQTKIAKDKPPMSPAERITKETVNLVDNTKNVAESVNKIKKINSKKESPSKKMSDEELRRAINRLEMEKRYDSLTNADTSKGYETFKEVMSVIGGFASAAASTALIVSVIKNVH